MAVWLLTTWTLLVERTIRYYCPFPSFDYWRVPYNLSLWTTRGIAVFFRPHNEHRIIFPEIVFVLDDLFFRGRLILPMVVSFVCYLGTWLIVARTVLRDISVPASIRWFGAVLAGIVLGWQGAAVVIGDPFLLQWTLSIFCVVLSVALVARTGETEHGRDLAIALVAAVIATYSSLNCLVLWPILLLESRMVRLARKEVNIIVAAAIICISLYFVGYHPDAQSHVLSSVRHPLQSLGFLTVYLAMPFALGKSDAFAISLGLLNVVVIVLLFLYTRRNRLLGTATAAILFLLYLFTFVTALLTATGRFDLAKGYGDATASRFWAIQLLNWATVVLLCTVMGTKLPLLSRRPLLICAVLSVLLAFGTFKLRSTLDYDDDQFAKKQLAALSFENGLEDDGLARRIFPSPAFVLTFSSYLKNHHLSIYSLPDSRWLGKSVSAVGSVVSDPHAGAVTYSFLIENGLELAGWADPDRRGPGEIVISNENGLVVGFGRRLRAGFPMDLRTANTPRLDSWVAFANLKYSAHLLQAWFLSRGQVEPLGAPLSVNLDVVPVANEPDKLITTVNWQMDLGWALNTQPFVYAGTIPRGTIYTSWKKSDRNTGEIMSSPIAVPVDSCLVIPVLHGENVHGLSVRIVNAESGHAVRTIPMQNGDIDWRYWRVTLDKPVTHVRIVAEDQGRDWGEWLDVSTPYECGPNSQE